MQIPLLSSGSCRLVLLCVVAVCVIQCVSGKIRQCPRPHRPHNGRVHYSGVNSGDRAIYSCNDGYKLYGGSTAVCQSSGSWSSATPTCQAPRKQPCPPLPPVPYATSGLRHLGSTTFILYKCRDGYQMHGRHYRICYGQGVWLGAPPVCRIPPATLKCRDPGTPSNGGRTITSQSVGGRVTYYCNGGYRLVGSETRNCVGDGRRSAYWSGSLPTCEVIVVQCGDPGTPSNGGRTITSQSVGGRVTYYCNGGYRLVGSQTRNCVGDGRGGASWSGSLPTCEAIVVQCGDPGTPSNGGRTITTQSVGGRVTYYCNGGYRLVGSQTRNCVGDGRGGASWSGSLPTCEAPTTPSCPPLPPVPYATSSVRHLGTTTYILYKCRDGYQMHGRHYRICYGQGVWLGAPPVCRIPPATLKCRDPGTPSNGGRTITSQSVGGRVTYYCNGGYRLVGSQTRNCVGDGRRSAYWSGSLPTCEAIVVQCGDPGTPSNGGRTITSQSVGGRVTYYCNGGYRLVGSQTRNCVGDGRGGASWSGSLPTCEAIIVRCGDPGTPSNGGRTITSQSVGGRVTYYCNGGYRLVGSQTRNCVGDGRGGASWSGSLPTCEVIVVQCGDPGTPSNGGRTITSQSVGGRVTYYCNGGYRLVGSETRNCVGDGRGGASWSGSLPTCEVIVVQCGDPGTPSNGGRTITSQLVGGRVTYQCNGGYRLVGSQTRNCVGDGRGGASWSGSLPTCEVIVVQCGDPGTPSNGGRTITSQLVGGRVTYQCNGGYRLVGSQTRNCVGDGRGGASWSGSLPTCEVIVVQCGDPGTPSNGGRTITSQSVGGRVTYYCDGGYRLVGSQTRNCVGDGRGGASWSGSLPTCEAIVVQCGDPGTPSNGGRTITSQSVGGRVTYQCNGGYRLVGSETRNCVGDGRGGASWSGSLPTCEAIIVRCGDPGTPSNGGRTITSQSVGGRVTYQCNGGYRLVGSQTRNCVGDGRGGASWSGSLPTCEAIVVQCGDPGTPSNGGRTITSQSVGGRVTYQCNGGYRLVGSQTRNCVGDGRGGASWSGSLPTCEAIVVQCGDPGTPSNGGRTITSQSVGGRVTYYCNGGYRLVGSETRNCVGDGRVSASWSGSLPTCEEVTCSTPEDIANGGREFTSLTVGSKAIYYCSTNYQISGERTRTCQSDRSWSPAAPTCVRNVITCAQFVQPSNGDVSYSSPSLSSGTTASFSCFTGYLREGLAQVSCLANGQWSGAAATCKRITCPTLPDIANADKTVDGDYTPGTTVIYVCREGYRGVGSAARRCLSDGRWSGSEPSCSLITCPRLSGVINAQASSDGDRRVGTRVTYSCSSGYRLSGASTLTCSSEGRWDQSPPSCTLIQCSYPGAPTNGFVQPPNRPKTFYRVGEVINYACQSSYSLEGSASLTCLVSGTWDSSVPSCEVVFCSNPGAPTNGFLASGSLDRYTVNSRIRFGCNRGFEIQGSAVITCLQSGTFSASVPSCEPISCGDPGTPDNGRSEVDDFQFQSIVTYSCNTGYRIQGIQTRQCQSSGRWSGLLPVCVVVDCGDPGNVQNGRRSLQGTKFGQTVNFQCNTGYQLEGTRIRTCQASGQWSDSQPSCSIVDCGDPGVLENGRRQLQSTTYRSTVTFQCNEGYKREGSQSRTCGANGAWSSSQPSCVEIDCGDPPSVSDGNVVFVSTGMDSRATYTCDRGYRLQGSSVRTCQDNEQWSAQSQRCIIVDCGNPGLPRNGRRTLSATTFGAQVTFECNSGFRIEGQSSRECQETGFWSSNVPECVAILCDDPGTPSNGRRELLSRTVDSRVIYRCNDGYTLDGSEFRTCGQNGQWSGSLPSCKLVECGDPGNVPNSVRSLSGVTYSSTVEYTCNRGFVLSGLRIRTCQRSGAWSGSAPSCQIISCGDPGSPRNGFKNSTQTTFGTVVEFDCNSGYALRGSKRISCGANAMWSASAPMCEISSCPDPGTPDKGSRVLGQLTVGSIVTYSCIRGYRIDGVQSRLCLPSRTWTGTLPGCIIVDCGNPGEPTNGVKVGSSTTFGSTVQYRCNEGYELDGNERRECQANGRWSGVLPRCVIGGCGDPGTPSNAVRDLSGSSVGSTVNYRCNTGYTISGTSFRVCQSSGSWSGRLPQCTKIDCGDPGTPSNGRLSLSDGTNFGSIVTYSCSEGYRLEGAETRTCLSGRVWSGSRPVCVSIGCGNPGSISNGNVIFSSSFDRFSIAEFSCSSGYTLSGSQTRVCLANGLWSAAQPDCELVDCGELDAPQNGRRNLTATTFNSEVVYSCNEGYRLSGSSKRTCGSDGKWTGSDPNCNPVDCGDPGDIQNGNRELLSGTIFRSTAVYSCSFGFEAVGSTIRTCQASGVWSNSVPTCNAILCEDPGAPTNGFRTLSSLQVNSVVTYRCSTGYVLDGSTSRICRVTKQWTGNQPTCKIVDCGQPRSLNNGKVELVDSTTFGDVARYSCDEGYLLQGSSRRTCQSSGQWSSSEPFCIKYDCGDLPSISNGNKDISGTNVGSRAAFTCNRGFRIVGSAIRVCQASAVWSGSEASCVAIDCGDPGTPRNGRLVSSGSTKFGAEISYECDEGFALKGSMTRECTESGWSGTLASCERVDCGDPGSVSNGGRTLVSTLFSSRVRYFCSRGYVLDGNAERTCGADGEWSGNTPSCVVVTCGDPGTPTNGARQLANQNFGTTVTYTCSEGYNLEGSRQRVCQSSGEWSNQVAVCKIVDCGPPGEPSNGDVNIPRTTFAAIVSYECDDGYELEGKSTRSCQANGQWEGSVPSCKPIDCGKPSEPRNGEAVYAQTVFKSSIRYICNQGYELSGNEVSVCQASGSYSGSVPTCTPVDCGSLSLTNGDVQLSSGTTLGSTASYTCNVGYELSGSDRRTCRADGAWSGSTPSCSLVDCGDPGTPARGSRSPESPSTTFNSKVEYSCDAGYELSGSQQRTCQASGQWSGELPSCTVVDCGQPEKPNNGDRRVLSTTFESKAQYECRRGYRLEGNVERTCQANGQWGGSVPECVLIDCGNPGDPDNGRVVLSSGATTLGSAATYICSTGYEQSSRVRRVCQSGGTWSGSEPTCSLVDCGDPGTPNRGQKLGSNTKFRATVLYRCDSGYALRGNRNRACQANGRWSGSLPVCELVDCGDPGTPSNGFRSVPNFKFSSVVSFSCATGYEISGPQTRSCQANGRWSQTLAECVVVTCGDPGTPTNGARQLANQNFGTTVTYTCSEGYNLEGSRQRVCQSSGEWSNQVAVCKIVDCGDPGTPFNGNREVSTTTFKSSVTYRCNTGYNLAGSESRECQANGRWSSSIPTCKPVDCGELRNPTNGNRVLTTTTLGSQVLYVCNRGYKLDGNERRTCESSGSWSGSEPSCAAIQCEDPGQPSNGGRQIAGRTVGSTVTYSCNTGYTLEGIRTRTCQENEKWTGSVPECNLIDCGDPLAPVNGQKTLTTTTFQSRVSYSCDSGYTLQGEQTRQCQANGRWSGFVPSCVPVDCRDPGTPDNGDRVLLSTKFRSTVLYSCKIGFRLEGEQRRTCQASGAWSNSLPVCKEIECGDPGEPVMGSKRVIGSGVSAVVQYTCNRGYTLDGDSSRVCQASGAWTGSVPTCTIVDCSDPGTPPNGERTLSATTFGSKVTYTCQRGFTPQGTLERTCLATGRWSNSLPRCVPSDCGEPASLTNGHVDFSSTSIGSTAVYRCSEGYRLRGSSSSICQSSGQWSGSLRECVLVSCGDPGRLLNGMRVGSTFTFKSTVTYKCNSGYVLRGTSERVCQGTGSWSGSLPRCELVDCGDPGTPTNGFKTGANYKFESTVTYSCATGYQLSGPKTRSCEADGSWSGTLPQCVVVSCGDPGTPANGQKVLEGDTFRSTVRYSCDEGYTLRGDRTRVCHSSGEWTGELPRCEIVSCGNPGTPINGMLIGDVFTYQSVVRFQCKEGFRVNGQEEIRCLATAEWSHSIPKCQIVQCEDPGKPANSRRTLTSLIVHSMVTYECIRGYQLVGTRKRTCQPNGQWNGTQPECTVVECGNPDVPVNGMILRISGNRYGSTVTYKCNTGYRLSRSSSRQCQDDGVWSGSVPTCTLVDCRDPGTPENGERDLTTTTYRSVVTYRCVMGYILRGVSERTCDADGRWSQPLPSCNPVDCGDPGTPRNAIRSLSATTLGSKVQYSCAEGYRREGSSMRQCLKSGQWSPGSLPTCVPITCSDPGTPANGKRTLESLNVDSTVTYYCMEGYRLVGSLTRTCQSNGVWTGQLPVCQVVNCGDPGTPSNGQRALNGTTFRSVVSYTCNDDYRMKGERQRRCLSSGHWSGSLPLCVPVDCGEPRSPQNGYTAHQGTTVGRTVSYSCNRGYNLVGNLRRTCLNTGLWSGSVPECRIVDCGSVTEPDNGRVTSSSTVLKSIITYSCNSGFVLKGGAKRACQENGEWSGSAPVCQRVDCRHPGQITNGAVSVPNTKFGSFAAYTCSAGYMLSGPQRRVCQADGTWSEFTPVCKLVRCSDPGTPSNGQRELVDTVVGSVVRFSCHKGHRLVGDMKRTCQDDSTWTGSTPTCRIVDCGDPGTPRYGSRSSLTVTTFGAAVTYTCNTGYILHGDSERRCLDNGQWSGTAVSCRAVNCGSPGSPDSGRVIFTNTTYLSVASYVCASGFHLIGRDVRQCQLSGVWSGAVPSCGRRAAVQCPTPQRPANGQASFSSTIAGSHVTYSCNRGYTLVGDSRRVCRADGQWTGNTPICRGLSCGEPERVSFGVVQYTSLSRGATATYSCRSGYRLIGSSARVCQENGRWSGSAPSCQYVIPVTCGHLNAPTYGQVVVGSNRVGGTAVFSCSHGYILVGSSVLTCQSNGQWSSSPPICHRIVTPRPTSPPTIPPPRSCGAPGSPANGRVVVTTTTIGSVASYVCNDGHLLVGKTVRVCQESGLWSGSVPVCRANTCGHPGTPVNGKLVGSDFSVGSNVVYVCNAEFTLRGDRTRQCQSGGAWSGSLPTCERSGGPSKSCSPPPTPDNGRIILVTDAVQGSIAFYQCFDGFELVDGSNRRVCQRGGTYSGRDPRCVPASATCQGSGEVVDACGRRCTCVGGTLTSCHRVRHDFLSLSSLEKIRYIYAVKLVSTSPLYKPLYDALIKKYKEFHDSAAFNNIPDQSQFLPWLRFYLAEYENMLRLVDCRITVPFWDFSKSPSAPYSTPYFDNFDGFGDSNDNNTKCVVSGPFRSGAWNVAPSAGGQCLKREYKSNPAFPSAAFIQNSVLGSAPNNFNGFHGRLKLVVFDGISCLVGGNMCGDNGPNDPLLLLLMARIDGIFDQWQRMSASHLAARYSTDTTTLVCTSLPVRDYHNNNNLPNGLSIAYSPPSSNARRRRSAILNASRTAVNSTRKTKVRSIGLAAAATELTTN